MPSKSCQIPFSKSKVSSSAMRCRTCETHETIEALLCKFFTSRFFLDLVLTLSQHFMLNNVTLHFFCTVWFLFALWTLSSNNLPNEHCGESLMLRESSSMWTSCSKRSFCEQEKWMMPISWSMLSIFVAGGDT